MLDFWGILFVLGEDTIAFKGINEPVERLEVDCRILFGMSPTDTYIGRKCGILYITNSNRYSGSLCKYNCFRAIQARSSPVMLNLSASGNFKVLAGPSNQRHTYGIPSGEVRCKTLDAPHGRERRYKAIKTTWKLMMNI